MPRLCSDSSRSYPGRSVRQAVRKDSVPCGNARDDRTEVSRGHSRRRRRWGSAPAGNEPRWNRRGSLTSPKDQTLKQGRSLNEFP